MLGVVSNASQLWARVKKPAGPISGFEGTSAGQHQFIRTERYQETPPSDLGMTGIYDRSFAERNGDRDIWGPWNRENTEGRWNPLWNDPYVKQGRKQQQYEWDFLTSHGPVEDVLLHRSNLSRAISARPYVIPTEKPPLKSNWFNYSRK